MKVIITVAVRQNPFANRRRDVENGPWKADIERYPYLLGAALGYRFSYSVLYTEVLPLCALLIGSQM